MTIAVTPRAARYNGVKGNTYGEGVNVHDSWLRVYDSQDSQARISGQKSSKRFDKKADKIMEFFLKAENMGHNRGSWLKINDEMNIPQRLQELIESEGKSCSMEYFWFTVHG